MQLGELPLLVLLRLTRELIMPDTAPLPQGGDRIRCRLKNGDVITGFVTHVWASLDTPCINLNYHGGILQVFPELGDTWEPANDTGLAAGAVYLPADPETAQQVRDHAGNRELATVVSFLLRRGMNES